MAAERAPAGVRSVALEAVLPRSNTAVTVVVVGTPVAPAAGDRLLRVGLGVSAAAVAKDQLARFITFLAASAASVTLAVEEVDAARDAIGDGVRVRVAAL